MGLAAPQRLEFCIDVLARLWIAGQDVVGQPTPAGERAVHRNERRMRRLGPYDTPAAVIGRQWYFAHDRAAQIADRLDRLGWREAA
jgi:2-hydroxychromene-2-carboxylate isomerase